MRRYRPAYFLGQAFKGLWRNSMMTLASVTVLLSCLIVMGSFSMLVMNIDYNLNQLGDMNEIAAFVESDVSYEAGSKVSLAPAVSAEGKSFLGWSTDPDAETAQYRAGSTYTVSAEDAVAGVVTLYAVWSGTESSDTVSVRYHAFGRQLEGDLPSDENTYAVGDTVTLADAVNARYSTIEFRGWTTDPAGTGEILQPGTPYTVVEEDVHGGRVTFYAVWSEEAYFSTYALTYDLNGAEGAEAPTDAQVRLTGIRAQLEKLEHITEIRFISKEETLEEEKAKLKDRPNLLMILETGENPYPDTFVLTYDDNNAVSALQFQLEHIDGIYKINCRSDLAESIENLKNGIILIFTWFMVLLFVVSVFVIINTVKLAVVYRSKEITIMRYVGATKWFIALPFELEGAVIGLISGVIAFFLQWFIYTRVESRILGDLQIIEMIPFHTVRPILIVGCLVIGVLTGFIGSLISIRKYLKA